ncbi:MAG: DUF5074 domain-containing protein [Bacteroidota bacterium]
MAPLGQYENGVLVINEGNFSDGDGSVTYYNRTSGELDQTIFQSVNEAPALGDVIQSGLSFNGLTYLIANNSNKVEVVNSFTFEGQFTMTDVALPRYMTVANGKGYLTEWVAFGAEGKVAVFNLATGEIEDELPVGNLPEAIVFANNKLFVTEAFGNSLYIIDLTNTSSITTLTLGNGTSQMVLDANNNLWVACSGGSDINFNPLNDGSLYRINTTSNEVELAIELNTNYGGKIATNSSRNTIYFYVGNSIFEIDALTDPNLSESLTPLFTVSEAISLYGIGVDPVTDIIYVGDSKSFLDDGEVFRFESNGSLIDSFQTGRGPNGFLFN